MDRLPEAVARWVQKVVRDCHASQKKRLQTLLPAYGLQGKCSKQTGFLVRSSSRKRATVRTRTFSAVRKSVAFPYYLLTSAFSGFAPGRLAGAFRAGTFYCDPQMAPGRVLGHQKFARSSWTLLSCRSRHGLVYNWRLASEDDLICDQIKSEIGVKRATVRMIRSSRSLVGFFLTLLQWETTANFLRRG